MNDIDEPSESEVNSYYQKVKEEAESSGYQPQPGCRIY